MKIFIHKNKFVLGLILVCTIVCAANYEPGTILSGWDTLHPEFNFPEYFRRIFFGVWQEHQGLGALASQSHAGEMARMFIYYPLSLVLPEFLLRYSYFFLTLILGPLGVYYFLRSAVLKEESLKHEVASFLAGMFYLFNLGTLQQFYVPLEMFATHFATLPWLLLFAVRYLGDHKRKDLIVFGIFTFFSASISHTATLWYVYLVNFTLFIIVFELLGRRLRKDLKRILILLLVTILVNAFWLLPNLYFIVTSGDIVSSSKINSLFSEEAFGQNRSFGTIKDLLIFKNFLFNWGEYIGNNRLGPLLGEWSAHLSNPFVLPIGYLFSAISILGIVYALVKKNRTALALLSILIVGVFFWLNENPPVGFIYIFLEAHVHFFKEAFRFPFTKFSILLIFAASVYFGYGILFILQTLNHERVNKVFLKILLFVFLAAFIYYAFPMFKGNLISPSMKVVIPNEYFQMFSWFNKQPQGRVASLPINSFWGWTYYNWNYQGSGFLWFGIKQPLLDRSFDRWTPYNEQYYREMSQAVYSKDKGLFENTIKKYDTKYILVDKNVIAPGPGNDPKTMYFPEIEQLIADSPNISKVQNFGPNIAVYEVKNTNNLEPFVLRNAQSVAPGAGAFYEDFAYEKYGDYLLGDNGAVFPFRDIIDNQNHMSAVLKLTQEGAEFKLTDKSSLSQTNLQKVESQVPADVFASEDTLLIYPRTPDSRENSPLVIKTGVDLENSIVSINHKYNFRVGKITGSNSLSLGQVYLDTKIDNSVSVYTIAGDENFEPDISNLQYVLFPCGQFDKKPEFGISGVSENSFSLFAKHSQVCMRFALGKVIDNSRLQSKKPLLGIRYDFSGDNSPNLCISKKTESSCLFYFSKNLSLDSSSKSPLSQYYAFDEKEIPNYEIKIFLDSTDLFSSKKVSYDNLTFSLSKPIFSIDIPPGEVGKTISNNSFVGFPKITVPYSGFRGFSFDITQLPKTNGDCPVFNPKGPTPVIREVAKQENPNYIRYVSKEGSFCEHFSYEVLTGNQAYSIAIKSRNVEGLPLRLCVINPTSRRCDIYTQLPKNKDFETDTYLLPNMGEGTGFDVSINNFAVQRLPSVNDIASINVIPIPYQWMGRLESGGLQKDSRRLSIARFSHPNPSLYTTILKADSGDVLVLPQSFDKGWAAYKVSGANILTETLPFIFGKRLTHLNVDNWANGWMLNENGDQEVIMIYLPQYLEYIGFILLLASFWFIIKVKRT